MIIPITVTSLLSVALVAFVSLLVSSMIRSSVDLISQKLYCCSDNILSLSMNLISLLYMSFSNNFLKTSQSRYRPIIFEFVIFVCFKNQ